MKATWKTMFAVLLTVVLAIGSGCKKETPTNTDNGNSNGGGGGNSNSDVRVTTYTPQDVTATTAVCGGDVIVTEGLTLTEIGVCWSTSGNPTPDGAHLSTDNWSEPFVCTLTGLEPNTRYYVRAYALRGLEYYYGTMKSFTTQAGGGGGGEIGYPSISVLQEEGYVQDGDVVDLDVEVQFGFQMASNTMTGKELKTLVIGIGDTYDYETVDLTGLIEYTYRDAITFTLEAKELIGEVTITATVTDVGGNSATVSMSLLINQPAQPLEQVPFEWVRQGHDSLNEEEMARCGLFWSSNSKDIFANIKPLDGAILYVCYGDDFEYITTDVEKAAYITNLAENGIPVESYRNVSCTMNAEYNDMLAVIAPDGGMHLIHVMYGQVEATASGTRISISGELK